MRVYRIARQKWINDHTGSGVPGRWNQAGSRALYTASSIALALLEILVRITPEQLPEDYLWTTTDIPEDSIDVAVDELPDETAKFGTEWLDSGSAVALAVPSVIVPELNYLLNPNHTDFSRMNWSAPQLLKIDPRLLRRY
jgi:RES domain-containing protein